MIEENLISRLRSHSKSRIFSRGHHIPFDADNVMGFFNVLDAVNKSYPIFLAYFAGIEKIDAQNVILALNFVHAWKSEKLVFGSSDLEEAAGILERARSGADILPDEVQYLANTTNGCISVATKLLHLVAPDRFGILDPHVYRYLCGGDWRLELEANGPASCFTYWEQLHRVITENDVSDIQGRIEAWLGYKVTAIRAVELVMFVRGKLASLDPQFSLEEPTLATALTPIVE